MKKPSGRRPLNIWECVEIFRYKKPAFQHTEVALVFDLGTLIIFFGYNICDLCRSAFASVEAIHPVTDRKPYLTLVVGQDSVSFDSALCSIHMTGRTYMLTVRTVP